MLTFLSTDKNKIKMSTRDKIQSELISFVEGNKDLKRGKRSLEGRRSATWLGSYQVQTLRLSGNKLTKNTAFKDHTHQSGIASTSAPATSHHAMH